MRFRPCIDIHNGKVKQIVGGSLFDQGDLATENFISEKEASFYANMYKEKGIFGGHVILLNGKESPFYDATKKQAFSALEAFKNGLQIGGGIDNTNAEEFLLAGASHVIVTSYVFQSGMIQFDNLKKLVEVIGKEHIVLDLSCKRKDDAYYIVTDRWQKFTEHKISVELLEKLSGYCDEFLVHAVDVEGKANGIEKDVVSILGSYVGRPITYAGGIHSFTDLDDIASIGKGQIDFTIGSALDIFGGNMKFEDVLAYKE